MKNKKLLALLAGTMLAANVGYAAPAANLEEGQTNIGYDHYNLSHSVDDDSFYLQHAVSPKFTLGLEQNNYSVGGFSARHTDITAQYKLDNNVHLIAGDRSYGGDADDSDRFLYGIGASVNLAPKLDGYASVVETNSSTDWQTGLAYKISDQTALHFGYKSVKEDGSSTYDGVGFGINHTF
jgi:hypothetical protein